VTTGHQMLKGRGQNTFVTVSRLTAVEPNSALFDIDEHRIGLDAISPQAHEDIAAPG
jgi:hypothetical protein